MFKRSKKKKPEKPIRRFALSDTQLQGVSGGTGTKKKAAKRKTKKSPYRGALGTLG